jgi:hypothetical protein
MLYVERCDLSSASPICTKTVLFGLSHAHGSYVVQGLSVSLIPSDPGSSPRLLCQTVTTCVSPSLTRHNLGAPHWSTSSTGSTSDPSKAHGGGGGLPGFGKSLLNAALSIGRHGPGQPAPGSRSGPSVDRHATLLELVSVKEGDTVRLSGVHHA